jgi:hypothetical protein
MLFCDCFFILRWFNLIYCWLMTLVYCIVGYFRVIWLYVIIIFFTDALTFRLKVLIYTHNWQVLISNHSKTCLTKVLPSLLLIRTTCITLLPPIMGIIVQVNPKSLYLLALRFNPVDHVLLCNIYSMYALY